MAEDTQVHRIAVRLLDSGDRHLLACNWLWHGQSVEDTLADLIRRLGLPADQAVSAAAQAELVSVESAPRHSQRYPILIHVLTMDFLTTAALSQRLAELPSRSTQPLNLCAEEDRLDEALAAWADGGRLDPLGTQAGQEILRVQRPGAYAVLGEGGKILLSQLARTKRWTLPGGGIDLGEQPSSSLMREIYEEAGLQLNQVQLIGVTTARWTGRAPDQVVEDFHAVQFLYTGQVPLDQEPQVMEVDGSTSAAEWVQLEEAAHRPLTYVARSGLRLLGVDVPVQ